MLYGPWNRRETPCAGGWRLVEQEVPLPSGTVNVDVFLLHESGPTSRTPEGPNLHRDPADERVRLIASVDAPLWPNGYRKQVCHVCGAEQMGWTR